MAGRPTLEAVVLGGRVKPHFRNGQGRAWRRLPTSFARRIGGVCGHGVHCLSLGAPIDSWPWQRGCSILQGPSRLRGLLVFRARVLAGAFRQPAVSIHGLGHAISECLTDLQLPVRRTK